MPPRSRWRFLAPLLWTALILAASGVELGADRTRARAFPLLLWLLPWADPGTLEALHWLARKAGHAAAYAGLGLLWGLALDGWRPALTLTVATAFVDELCQATTVTREGSAADLLLDVAGAGTALGLLRDRRATVRWLTTSLLWFAAVGGGAGLLVHVAAGLPSGWLWLSTPAAWLALAWRRRSRRPAP